MSILFSLADSPDITFFVLSVARYFPLRKSPFATNNGGARGMTFIRYHLFSGACSRGDGHMSSGGQKFTPEAHN